MRRISSLASAALGIALALTAPTMARAQFGPVGGVWTAVGSTMTFTFVSRDADFTHQLMLFTPDGTPASDVIFVGGQGDPGSPVTVTVTPGQQYMLGLAVEENGTTFFSNGTASVSEGGDSASNFIIAMQDGTDDVTRVAIEDLRQDVSDEDFNDMVVLVSTHVPEPATMFLMGTGAAALGLLRWRRRRHA